MKAHRWTHYALMICTALALAACDDDPPAGNGGGEPPLPTRDQGMAIPDAGLPVADMLTVEPDMAPPIDMAPTPTFRVLVLEGDSEPQAFFGGQIALQVRYLSSEMTPVSGSVKVKLYDEAGADRTAMGVDGSVIDRADLRTDAEGRARFQITAGAVETVFTAEASADLAEPVRWTITVARNPEGGVAVRVVYPAAGRYPVGDFTAAHVGLFAGTCDEARGLPRGALGFAHQLPDLMPFDGDDTAAGGALPDGRTYAAIAWADSALGVPVAWGCTDDLTIMGGGVAQATVTLGDDPLEYKGTFNVEHAIELSDLLAAEEGGAWGTLATIIDVLRVVGEEPGRRGPLLVGLLCEQLDVDPADCGFLQAFVGPLLDGLIEDNAPPEALQALRVIGDVTEILGRPRLVGEMVFIDSFPDVDGLLLGNESRWQGMRFAWRNGCDFPDRARCERTLSLVDDAGLPRRSIAAPFDARVEADDQLIIGSHTMRLHFGRIALGVLEAWLLPEIFGEPGPITIANLFGRLIPCADLNTAIPPFDPMSGVCEGLVIAPLAQGVTEAIENLGLGLDVMNLQGRVTVADLNPDRQVDRLVDGVWDIAFGDSPDVVPEAGTWSGCRVGECPEDAEPAP